MSIPAEPPSEGLSVWPREPADARRLLALLALAALLRVTYLAEYLSLPFLEGPLFDSPVYLRQAASIHAGRLADPTLLAFSPLYGYFLALFGPDPRLIPVLAQLLLGLATLYLLHRTVAALFDEKAALIAGLLMTGYGLVVFFETKLMSETLGLALLVSAVAALASASFRKGGPVAIAGAGVLLALAVLARASLLFTLPLFVLAALWSPDAPWRVRARRGLGLALSIGLVLGTHGLHNLARTGLFVPVILQSQTAAEASRAEWTGRFDVFGEAPSPWDVVEQARERLARAARGEPEPPAPSIDLGRLLAGVPKKAALTFRDTETSFDYGYYGERSEARAFALLPVTFGALACLALGGAIVLVRRRGWKSLVFHLPILLGILAVTTIFHPSSRYRLPMVVPLVMLAAYGIRTVLRLETRRRWLGAGAIGALVVAFAIPTVGGMRLTRPAAWHVRVAEAAVEAGQYEEALSRVERARELGAEDDPALRMRLERLGASERSPRYPRSP